MILLGATLALRAGDRAEARAAAERSLAGCEQLGSALTGACRVFLARLDRQRRRRRGTAGARGPRRDQRRRIVVRGTRRAGATRWFRYRLRGFAEGARLLAAAAALHERMGQRCWLAGEVNGSHSHRGRTRRRFARIAIEGQRMEAPAAVAYARRARGERRRPSFGWDSLTPTELEVVRLAAAGLTNPAIGERLFISRGTVEVLYAARVGRPARHGRDVRSELLVKLALLDRAGANASDLVRAQRDQLTQSGSLEERLRSAEGPERTVMLWRREAISATLRFLDALEG